MRKIFAIAMAAATLTGAGDSLQARTSSSAEVIIEWNQTLQDTVPNAGLMTPRFFSMMHIAIFDPVNAIDHEYTSYHPNPWLAWRICGGGCGAGGP